MKIETIAVVLTRNGIIDSVKTYSQDDEGTKEAEKQFLSIVRDAYHDDDEYTPEEGLENGGWANMNGTEVAILWT